MVSEPVIPSSTANRKEVVGADERNGVDSPMTPWSIYVGRGDTTNTPIREALVGFDVGAEETEMERKKELMLKMEMKMATQTMSAPM